MRGNTIEWDRLYGKKGDQPNDQANTLDIKSLDDILTLVDQANDQAKRVLDNAVHDKVMRLLNILLDHPVKRAVILNQLGLKDHNRIPQQVIKAIDTNH